MLHVEEIEIFFCLRIFPFIGVPLDFRYLSRCISYSEVHRILLCERILFLNPTYILINYIYFSLLNVFSLHETLCFCKMFA